MAKKDHKLVAHVDAQTYERFNALAERLGDRPSALLRKLVVRTVENDLTDLVDAGPLGSRRRRTAKSPK